MTTRERIDAAIAARDKATPGPLKVVFKGTIGKYAVEKQEGSVHRQLAYCGHADALLFAAAYDLVDEVIRLRKEVVESQMAMAGAEALVLSHEGTIEKRDAEISRLRKWQEEVLPYLNLVSARLEPSHLDFIRFNDAIDDINRLIADAQGD